MADTICISVKLFATLKKYLPAGQSASISLTLPAGSVVQDAVEALHIPREQAGLLVTGDIYIEPETPLSDGQELSIFPPLAGGQDASPRTVLRSPR
jgi:molybdopterin converting factor small subunit